MHMKKSTCSLLHLDELLSDVNRNVGRVLQESFFAVSVQSY